MSSLSASVTFSSSHLWVVIKAFGQLQGPSMLFKLNSQTDKIGHTCNDSLRVSRSVFRFRLVDGLDWQFSHATKTPFPSCPFPLTQTDVEMSSAMSFDVFSLPPCCCCTRTAVSCTVRNRLLLLALWHDRRICKVQRIHFIYVTAHVGFQ